MENNFFGSKLNSVLLLILIILMVVVLWFMFQNKETYLPKSIKDNNNENVIRVIEGNKDDLLSLSILPNAQVSGMLNLSGEVKGAYFFEANILVNILDNSKNLLKSGNGQAVTDWMTVLPVSFTANLDFTGLPLGPAYLEIQNDDPSGGEAGPAKKILIPIIIN